MGTSATTLYSLVNQKVNITTPVVTLANWEQIVEDYERPCVFIRIKYTVEYVGNDETDFELELTWLKDHPQKYDIGEEEFHLAFKTDDMEAAHKLHEEMGCICFENPSMGIYFIQDPDGYWLEIIPADH